MRRITVTCLLLGLSLALAPVFAAWAAAPGSPTLLEVEAEGKVLAKPDMARMVFEVVTQAPQAQAAAQENARRAEAMLEALKKALGPEEKVQSLGYWVNPVTTYNQKLRRTEITGYKAENRFQAKLKDLNRLGQVIDTALHNGANEVRGPYFEHSRLEELQEQAYAAALKRARRLAEALAQAQGLKVIRISEIYTSRPPVFLRRAPKAEASVEAGTPAPATPIEVGEEEIRAHLWAVFELGP
jgi:uncharacterized protein YggE